VSSPDKSPGRTFDLADETETAALAARLAAIARPGDFIALSGPLGAGKTSFARAFIRALAGPATEVPSPTFTLVQTYDSPKGTVWHGDLYRVSAPEEAIELGIEEALGDSILLVEWPERLGPFLPARRCDLSLSPGASPSMRQVRIEDRGGADLVARLDGFAP
jgi:tRNA threonylcarbamoyladenosine biosynthesis protein TsaE